MKTFIIAAVTADGYIGQDESHLSTRWTTNADKAFFTQKTKEAGAIICGRTTYQTFKRALPGRETYVYTSNPQAITEAGVTGVDGAPADVLQKLEADGVQTLAICGGAHVYGEFLQAGLVDELYLTVHPVLFGAGIPLLRTPFLCNLELLDTQNIGDGTVLLHYKLLPQPAE